MAARAASSPLKKRPKQTRQEKQDKKLEKRFKKLQGGEFSRRLQKLGTEATSTTPEELFLFLKPEEVEQAAEAKYGRLAYVIEAIRNALVLLPLMVTWLSLALAGEAYNEGIKKNPALSTEPFLQQWGDGFAPLKTAPLGPLKISLLWHKTSWFTFSHVALADGVVLFLLFLLTACFYLFERQAQTSAVQLRAWTERTLLNLSEQSLHRWGKTPEGTQRALANKMNEALVKLEQAIADLKKVMEQEVMKSVGTFNDTMTYQNATVDRYVASAEKFDDHVGKLTELYGSIGELYEKMGGTLPGMAQPPMDRQDEGPAIYQDKSARQVERAARDIQNAARKMKEAAASLQGGSAFSGYGTPDKTIVDRLRDVRKLFRRKINIQP